jgi:hypothetical protein
MDALGGALRSLGAALVTVTVKVWVTEAGRGSETVNVMVYTPVSAMEVDVTYIVKAEGIVNIPLGIVTAAPPFKE